MSLRHRPFSRGFTNPNSTGRQLENRVKRSCEAWEKFARFEKQPKRGDFAADLFALILEFWDECSAAAGQCMLNREKREAEKAAKAAEEARMVDAERELLAAEHSAMTATEVRQAALITERGKSAANPTLVDLIKRSDGAAKKDLKDQREEAAKPAFDDLGQQITLVHEDLKSQKEDLIQIFKDENDARKQADARRGTESKKKLEAYQAIADAARGYKRGMADHPDLVQIEMDQKESAM